MQHGCKCYFQLCSFFVGINNKPREVIGTPEVVVCGTENAGFVNIVRKGTKFERCGPFLLRNKVNVLFCWYRNIAREAEVAFNVA